MLQNAYFLAKIGADTAENEQHFAEILPKTGNYHTGRAEREGAGPAQRRSPELRTCTGKLLQEVSEYRASIWSMRLFLFVVLGCGWLFSRSFFRSARGTPGKTRFCVTTPASHGSQPSRGKPYIGRTLPAQEDAVEFKIGRIQLV